MASRSKRNVKKTIKRKNQIKGGGKRSKKLSKKVKKTLKKGMNWMKCLSQARKELGIKGFVAIKKGTPLYKRAKEICGK